MGYGSGILVADVTRDEKPDLIYGGWWLPVEILVGDGQSFSSIPSYTSSMTSVVETIQLADLGKETLVSCQDEFNISYEQSIVYLTHEIIDEITGILKNGTSLVPADYTFVPNKNWISFAEPLLSDDQVIVNYMYCLDGDLIITNWDSDKGNFIYYNNASPVALNDHSLTQDSPQFRIFPQPVTEVLYLAVDLSIDSECRVRIYAVSGSEMKSSGRYPVYSGSNIIPLDVTILPAAVYFIEIDLANEHFVRKFVKF